MSYIIDRRQVSKEKSTVNRQRFLRRYRDHVKRAVSDAVSRRSITDIESGEKISIPSRDLSEPVFGHGPGGKRQRVYSGNKEFIAGDKIKRPPGGGGGQGGGKASDSGEGEDEFVFQISQEEFLHYMFEDLELPNLVKRQLAGSDTFKRVRAGYSTAGNPSQINIVRSMRSAYARRIAMSGGIRKRVKALEAELAEFSEPLSEAEKNRMVALEEQLTKLKRRKAAVPFLDDFDLRYNLHVKYPLPTSKAVMFCIMDVSGSMDQETKDTAKRFFILLYLFLKRNYERTEVVFIRHHSTAKEVDEEEFFYSRETGGTVVSSALKLMREIIEERYPTDEWNIYGAQASDGDNWNGDSQQCYELLTEGLLPQLQYYTYIEITDGERQELWNYYERVLDRFEDCFAIRHLSDRGEIYPVFRELFQKKMEGQP